MSWNKSNLTKPNDTREELEKMIRERSSLITYPAKKYFLNQVLCWMECIILQVDVPVII